MGTNQMGTKPTCLNPTNSTLTTWPPWYFSLCSVTTSFVGLTVVTHPTGFGFSRASVKRSPYPEFLACLLYSRTGQGWDAPLESRIELSLYPNFGRGTSFLTIRGYDGSQKRRQRPCYELRRGRKKRRTCRAL